MIQRARVEEVKLSLTRSRDQAISEMLDLRDRVEQLLKNQLERDDEIKEFKARVQSDTEKYLAETASMQVLLSQEKAQRDTIILGKENLIKSLETRLAESERSHVEVVQGLQQKLVEFSQKTPHLTALLANLDAATAENAQLQQQLRDLQAKLAENFEGSLNESSNYEYMLAFPEPARRKPNVKASQPTRAQEATKKELGNPKLV
eukprot:c12317_g1_i1.p1 GENE.c12317_g1_i1~~c12317_g1_i1.p1  ORF type:complete len:205 (+),score=36.85 c12317_g1_i1:331-945(+)